MNNLYLYWMSSASFSRQSGFPAIAWACYLAFDAGEYYRDDSTVDPSEKYTRPLIEDLLKKLP